jgi:DNA-binding transcriptional ArsR family regulator
VDEGKITLDAQAFKALASDTRLQLMKLLDRRPMTVSELSRETTLNKATLLEHLEKLSAASLAERLEDERKWVYYQLTWRGKRILHPEKITIALMLSTGMATLATAALSLWLYFAQAATQIPGSDKAASPPASGPETQDAGGSSSAAGMQQDLADRSGDTAAGAPATDATLLYLATALLVLFALILALGYWQLKKDRIKNV